MDVLRQRRFFRAMAASVPHAPAALFSLDETLEKPLSRMLLRVVVSCKINEWFSSAQQ